MRLGIDASPSITPLITVDLRREQDVVRARQRARTLAALLGFGTGDQTRIATAVSELARNAFRYAHGGRVRFTLHGDPGRALWIHVEDHGPGIPHLDQVLNGRYRSTTGMGQGIVSARRLMDSFRIDAEAGQGTRVDVSKELPAGAPPVTPAVLAKIASELQSTAREDPFGEVQEQNRELLLVLEELRAQEAEVQSAKERLEVTNRELEETNRGVVALYAELDEKADYLQKSSDLKSRFLSNMSHEFRTPLNSILSLSQLLLDRVDGDLSAEQEKQVTFIRKSAAALSELVNDLLDLAKVEAGKITVRPQQFEVGELFATLRGMLRPMLAPDSPVQLIFEEPAGLPTLFTDEGKVSQILRNFISNALKYTERGEVRVVARPGLDDTILFSVADTGIGIAPEDQERVWEEFAQVEHPLQRRVRGTGLGLPLTRKLAELLGGSVLLHSEPGSGSRFTALIPVHYATQREAVSELSRTRDPSRLPLLVLEPNRETLVVYERSLKGTGYQAIPAGTIQEARAALREIRPAAILLDILLDGENAWGFLQELKADPDTRKIPVLVVTVVDNRQRALDLGADGFALKPLDREWLLTQLRGLAGKDTSGRILLIDDDEVSRYLFRGLLTGLPYQVVEAADGEQGLQLARSVAPRAIFLDLMMPGLDGFALLEWLKADPCTSGIPVIVHTSRHLNDGERARLAGAAAILNKESPSRQAAKSALYEVLEQVGIAIRPGEP